MRYLWSRLFECRRHEKSLRQRTPKYFEKYRRPKLSGTETEIKKQIDEKHRKYRQEVEGEQDGGNGRERVHRDDALQRKVGKIKDENFFLLVLPEIILELEAAS